MPKTLVQDREIEFEGRNRVRMVMRSQMVLHQVSYRRLVELLAEAGVTENEANLRNKVTKGEMSASLLLTCLGVMDVGSFPLPRVKPLSEIGDKEWPIERALDDDLISVVERDDENGVYRFQIGKIPTIITIKLERLENRAIYSISHVIKTPAQLSYFLPAQRIYGSPGRALHDAIGNFTLHYREAVSAGHTPSSSWLLATARLSKATSKAKRNSST